MPTPEEEKLQYLKREEIRTMSKDASALRESEAQRERQRVAKIRVGEERQQEPARQQAAAQAAQQRVETTKQARQKEEELIKSKEERLEIQQKAAVEAEKQLEQRKTAFGQQLERVQVPEEQARRSFLERVAAKAEGREAKQPTIEEPIVSRPRIPVPEIPTPPTLPAPVQPTPARRPVQTPVDKPVGKPGGYWAQIAIILASLAVLGAIGTFWYWYFVVREEAPVIAPIEQPKQPEEPQEPVISTPQINDALINTGYRVPETPRTINTIIIHSIYNILEGSPYSVSGILGEYKQFNVAHHYLIDREGNVYRIVAEENIAYHAGPSRNSSSIGIGIINTESDTPAQTQYESLTGLILDLQEKYGIAAENIVRRQDVVTDASNNPANFDWQYFMSLIQ